MLLTIDIGNTNITMGVFEEEFLLGMFRMTTKTGRGHQTNTDSPYAEYWSTEESTQSRSIR